MLAAGIDLSGRTTGTTAVAWLEADPPRLADVVADRALRDDAELLRRCLDPQADVVAIDAPLSLPHPVTCTDPACPRCFPPTGTPRYGSRAVDGRKVWTDAGHVEKPPMPTVMLAGIAFRAIYLRRRFEREGLHVIETWPMGTYRVLARAAEAPPGDTGEAWRRTLLVARVHGLERLERRVGAITDRLDAVAAAYAGWCWLAGRAAPVRAEDDEIWIPAG